MARILQIKGSSSPSRFVCKVSQRDGVFLGPIHSVQIYVSWAEKYGRDLAAMYSKNVEFEIINMSLQELKARIRSSERQYDVPEAAERKLKHYKE